MVEEPGKLYYQREERKSMTQEEEKNQHEQQKLLQAGMTGVQTDIVQRYGSAIKGHAVA